MLRYLSGERLARFLQKRIRKKVRNMLKRIVALLLVLTFMLSATAAWAAPGDVTLFVRNDETSNNISITTAAAVGDTLYILANQYDEENSRTNFMLYGYTHGRSGEPELLADNIGYSRWYSSLEDAKNAQTEGSPDPETGIGYLFSDGGKLYGMNTLNGEIAVLTFANGAMNREVACTIPMEDLYIQEDDYAYIVDMNGMCAMDGHAYFSSTDWRSNEPLYFLYDINLADGSLKKTQVTQRLSQLMPYKDGKLLGFVTSSWDTNTDKEIPAQLVTVNPADGAMATFREMPDVGYINGMTYHAATDTAYYLAESTLWGMTGQGDPFKAAYSNQSYADGMTMLASGYCALWGSDGLEIHNMDPAYLPTKTLTIIGSWRDSAARQFSTENPDIPLIFSDDFYSMSELGQAMVSGDATIDVIRSNVQNGFENLRDKGYCADLSSSQKLMDYVNSLYPALKDEVLKDGKLYAIPVSIYGSTLSYQPSKLEEIGLTPEDMPTTFVELCEFITRWNNEWIDDENKVNVMPFCTTMSNRSVVFDLMLKAYLDYYDAKDEPLTFDTPEFNAMLTALDSMDASNLDMPQNMTDLEYDEFYQLYSGVFVDRGLLSEAEGDYAAVPLKLSISEDKDFTVGVSTEILFVNPRCANLPEAIKLLECYVDSLYDDARIMMCPDNNDPIENPYYEEIIKSFQTGLEDLQEQLKTADAAQKRDLEDVIQYYEQALANQESYRWNYSAATIAQYREIGDHVFPRHANVLYSAGNDTTTQLRSLHERYVQKQITREQYIKELNQKARMIVLENQ